MIAISLVALLAAMAQPVPAASATPEAAASAVPATPAPATPGPTGSATPGATPPASPVPSAVEPAQTPTATATAPATTAPAAPAPAPSPTMPPPSERPTSPPYGFRFVPRQPDHVPAGQPQIFAVYLNSNKLKSLGPIDIKVSTSPDVVKVMTVSNGRESAIPMIGPGDFEATSKLPKLPFIASGVTTVLNFVAVGASGKRVSVPVPVSLQ